MENQGWVCLYRKFLDWEWYDDKNTKVLFIHLLLKANHKDKKWRGILIKRGQRLTSYSNLAKETRLTLMQTRTALSKLKSTGEITIKTTNKYTVITVNNYTSYQDNNTQDNNQVTNKQQTNNKQITTNNNDNNTNNENKNISKDIGGKTPEYGDKFINLVEKFLKDRTKYPQPLSDIHDRRRLQNLKQVLSPRKGKDEFMSENPLENFKEFILDYYESYDMEYRVRSVKRLVDYAKSWRENGGSLINEVKQEQERVVYQSEFQQEQAKLKEEQRKLYENN